MDPAVYVLSFNYSINVHSLAITDLDVGRLNEPCFAGVVLNPDMVAYNRLTLHSLLKVTQVRHRVNSPVLSRAHWQFNGPEQKEMKLQEKKIMNYVASAPKLETKMLCSLDTPNSGIRTFTKVSKLGNAAN